MMMETVLSRSIRLVFAGGIALGMQAAYAQEATEKIEKVEVTGSRIATKNIEGTSPITTIGEADIKADGVRNVESLLNNLPQVFANQGASVSNGATGTATVDLRGLGPSRTLVLINGKRMPAGSPLNTAADLNQVPTGLIKRVEILSGGAGAVYGSDAVAGVVNFIMNDKFEGVQVDINQSGFNHSQHNGVADTVRARGFVVPGDKSFDAKSYDASILLGGNFADGKGNATVFASYKKDDALYQSERDFTACSLAGGAKFACSGSSTSFPGRFILDDGAGASRTVADANGTTRAFKTATDAYNFGPSNLFQRPDERYVFNASANYQINDKIKAYTTIAAHDDHTKWEIAPSGMFGVSVPTFYENPLLSAAWKTDLGLVNPGDTSTVFTLRRNVEGGGRIGEFNGSSHRGLVGAKGDIGPWSYDVFMQSSKVSYSETDRNYFLDTTTLKALDVITDPSTGQPACRSFVNGTDPNCVPYNIWSLGQVTPAALAYLNTTALRRGSTQQYIQGGNISADLGDYGIKLPLAQNGIGVSMGVERRVEKLDFVNDSNFASGNLAGGGGPSLDVTGQYTVKEIFGEARVPLIEKRPFAELLAVNGSYRHSDYSTDKKADSYGFGAEWAPVKEVRLRGSYQRAVRAANINELFTPTGLGLFNMASDPCSGATPTETLANCARSGVTAAQYGKILDSTAGQFNGIFGGNTALNPERSNSYTLGLVLTPIKNLSVTFDAFSIEVKDVIGVIPGSTIVQQCLTSGNPVFCSLIHRDDVGSLWLKKTGFVSAGNLNLGSLKQVGLDIGGNFTHKLNGWGGMAYSFNGTYINKYDVENVPGMGKYDCTGLYGATCGNPTPDWRHKARAVWTSPWNTDLALTWRHINKVTLDTTSSNPLLTGSVPETDRTLGARDYLDLAGTWQITKQWSLNGGVNNVFDRDPPITSGLNSGAPYGNGNTYPGVYDAMGRKIFVSLTGRY